MPFVAGSTKISFVSLKTSLKGDFALSDSVRKVSVTERMHILPSRFVQYSRRFLTVLETWKPILFNIDIGRCQDET